MTLAILALLAIAGLIFAAWVLTIIAVTADSDNSNFVESPARYTAQGQIDRKGTRHSVYSGRK